MINARVISFLIISMLPLWGCLIAGTIVLLEEKINDFIQRHRECQ